jgi:hypothetical protein
VERGLSAAQITGIGAFSDTVLSLLRLGEEGLSEDSGAIGAKVALIRLAASAAP